MSMDPSRRVDSIPGRSGHRPCSGYLNNRYMDPTIGTFLSVDPLVSKTGQAYLYAAGSPTSLSDPSGLDPDTDAHVRDRAKENGYCTYSAGVSGGNACGANGLYWGSSSDPVASATAKQNWGRGPAQPACSARVDVSPGGGCVGSKCDFYSCDLYVVTTYLGGDFLGGGSVSVSLFGGGELRFADAGLAVSPNGLSTAMYFPRNHVTTEDQFWDLYGQLDGSITPSAAVQNAILYPPDAEITINVAMVGFSDALAGNGGVGGIAHVGEAPGSGGSYFVEVWWNPGGPAGGQPGSSTVWSGWSPA